MKVDFPKNKSTTIILIEESCFQSIGQHINWIFEISNVEKKSLYSKNLYLYST